MSSAPSFASAIAVVFLIYAIGLFVQGVAESTSVRVFGVMVFLIWMIPFFAMVILLAAFEAFEAGMYTGQPFPPVALGFSTAWMLETTAPPAGDISGFRFLPPEDEVPMSRVGIAYAGVAGYAIVASLVQRMRRRRRQRLWHEGM